MTHKIADLSLAAYLQTKGHKLLQIEGNGYRSVFVFENTPEIEEDSLAYYNREGQVVAIDFAERIRNLKGLAVARRDKHQGGKPNGYDPKNAYRR